MATYELASYASDWRFYDGVGDARYVPPTRPGGDLRVNAIKLKEIDQSEADWLPINGVSSDSESQTWLAWNNSDETFEPQAGGFLEPDAGGSLRIGAVRRSPHGHWTIATTKGVEDTE